LRAPVWRIRRCRTILNVISTKNAPITPFTARMTIRFEVTTQNASNATMQANMMIPRTQCPVRKP
jgi:hypothetical protein